MLPYFFISFISIFFSLLYYLSDRKSRLSKLFLFLSFISLFIFSAIRYNVYTDYLYTYVPEYYHIAYGTSSSHYEILFYLLNLLVYYIFNNVDWLFIMTSLIFIIFTGKSIKENSTIIPLSIFLLIGGRMFFYSFDQIRQYIGVAIFLYNIKNIANKNWKKYFFWVIIAGLIHKLSFMYLPLYFLNKININRKKYIITMLIIIALSPIYISIINDLAVYFYSDYFNYGSFVNGTRINNSFVLIILSIINICVSIIYYNRLNSDKYYRILLYIQLVLLFIILGTWNLFDSYRIVAMFLYTSILLLPKTISVEKNIKIKYVLLIFIIGVYFVSGYSFIKNVSVIHPYTTIFNK